MSHHRHQQTLAPHPPLFLYPLCSSSSSPLRRLPCSRSSQAAKETSMGFSVLEEEFVPLGHSFGDGDDWAVGVGQERSSLFGLEDFLLDDPLVDGHLSVAAPEKVTGMEPHEDEDIAAISVEESKSNHAYSCSSTPAAAAVTPPLPLSEITLPEHDAAELEWVSRMTDDSQSEMPAYHHHQPLLPAMAPTPPPSATATADTNNSSTRRRTRPADDAVAPVKAKRSKRARGRMSVSSSSSWSWRQDRGWSRDDGAPSVTSNSSSSATSTTTATTATCSSYSSASSQLVFAHQLFDKMPVSFPRPSLLHPTYSTTHIRQQRAEAKPKRRGPKPKAPHLAGDANNSGGERRCGHCGVNKTPQWRTGPMGAKTLCNACGVRYKSGRLLPEYRPACSPTFVSHVHSNSHRKVLEMRRKRLEEEEDEDEPQEQQRRQSLPVSVAPPIASF